MPVYAAFIFVCACIRKACEAHRAATHAAPRAPREWPWRDWRLRAGCDRERRDRGAAVAVAAVEGCWRGATLRRAVEGRLDEEGVREGEAFELCLAEVRMVEGDVAPARLAQVGAPAHKPHLRVKRAPSLSFARGGARPRGALESGVDEGRPGDSRAGQVGEVERDVRRCLPKDPLGRIPVRARRSGGVPGGAHDGLACRASRRPSAARP